MRPGTLHAPGSHLPLQDLWGRFDAQATALPAQSVVLVDKRVLARHPHLREALARAKPAVVVELRGGEGIKTFATAERILVRAVPLRRGTTFLAIGGGTVGDLATVVAHLHKRGARLIHVPTTILSAVDSSVGGKGAVDLGGVKNAAGVFHYATQSWLCPELFDSLAPAQVREGGIEAWKMALCLSPKHWRAWTRSAPTRTELIRASRSLKAAVCERDPYEHSGLRRVLNFGHTFGHALETISGFRLSHGDAVGLGMLCALDVGRAVGVTSDTLARTVEAHLASGPEVPGRSELSRVLRSATMRSIRAALVADKKRTRDGALTMVLLERVGRTRIQEVPNTAWRPLLRVWSRGARP